MTDIVTKTQTQGKRGPKMAKYSPPEAEGAVLQKVSTYRPSEQVETFVQVLLSKEVGGNKVKAEEKMVETFGELGYTRQAFNKLYRENPDFRAWFLDKRNEYLGSNGAKFDTALVNGNKDDIPQVRTFYEMEGRIGPKAHQDAPMRKGFKVTIVGEMPEEPRETKEAEVIDDDRKD